MKYLAISAAILSGILAAPLPSPSEPHRNPLSVGNLPEHLGIVRYTIVKTKDHIQSVSFFIGLNPDNIYAYCHQDGITTLPSADTTCTLASQNSPKPFSTNFQFHLTKDNGLKISDMTASAFDHKPYTASIKAPSVDCKPDQHNTDAGADSQVRVNQNTRLYKTNCVLVLPADRASGKSYSRERAITEPPKSLPTPLTPEGVWWNFEREYA